MENQDDIMKTAKPQSITKKFEGKWWLKRSNPCWTRYLIHRMKLTQMTIQMVGLKFGHPFHL